MTHWPARPSIRLRLDRRAIVAPVAPRLIVGALAVLLFSVDSLRPLTDLSDKRQKNAAGQKTSAEKPSDKSGRKHVPDTTVPAWTTPWIPSCADAGLRVCLELALRAGPSSPRSNSQAGSGSTPVWDIPLGPANAWRAQLALASDRICTAAEVGSFSLLSCRQICPMGPPAA